MVDPRPDLTDREQGRLWLKRIHAAEAREAREAKIEAEARALDGR